MRRIGRLFQKQLQHIGKPKPTKLDGLMDKHVPHEKHAQVAQHVALFESQLVLLALDKKHQGIELCDSMEHAALAFCPAVQETIGVTVSNEWDGLKITPKSSSLTTTAVAAKLREFDASGQLKDPSVLLREAGFLPGKWIARKKDKLQAQLQKFEGGNVIIECEGEQYIYIYIWPPSQLSSKISGS